MIVGHGCEVWKLAHLIIADHVHRSVLLGLCFDPCVCVEVWPLNLKTVYFAVI